MDTIGLPLLLLAAIWGSYTSSLKALEMANEHRDKILDTESKLTLEHRWWMLSSAWGLFLGNHGFQGLIAMLVFFSPSVVNVAHEDVRSSATILFFITGGILVVVTVVSFIWGVVDFVAMRKHLLKLEMKKLLEKAEAPPAEKDVTGHTGITDRR
jgi:hypothetical protein